MAALRIQRVTSPRAPRAESVSTRGFDTTRLHRRAVVGEQRVTIVLSNVLTVLPGGETMRKAISERPMLGLTLAAALIFGLLGMHALVSGTGPCHHGQARTNQSTVGPHPAHHLSAVGAAQTQTPGIPFEQAPCELDVGHLGALCVAVLSGLLLLAALTDVLLRKARSRRKATPSQLRPQARILRPPIRPHTARLCVLRL